MNSFAPWLLEPEKLPIGEASHFRSVTFGENLMVLPRSGGANLDILAMGFDGVVAVESKFLEILAKPLSEVPFKAGYEYFRNKPNFAVWYEQVRKLSNHPEKYSYHDTRQLVAGALGLDAYRAHREEVEAFRTEVHGATVRFESMTFSELWDSWGRKMEPPWLKGHVEKLRKRYQLNL